MAASSDNSSRIDDSLQEVQALQKDLKAFSRAVNKPLRDHVIYSSLPLDGPSARVTSLPASQSPGDVAILDRLKAVRALPGKARTAALVRQALTLQDGNAQTPTTISSPPTTQRQRKGSLQPTPRQEAAQNALESLAPVTAVDFQEQLYDNAGAIDLTRVRLKIKQHQQDLIAAGLQAPPEEPEPAAPAPAAQEPPSSKLRWQTAASRRSVPAETEYNLRYCCLACCQFCCCCCCSCCSFCCLSSCLACCHSWLTCL